MKKLKKNKVVYVSDADIVGKNGPPFYLNGKNKLEVNPSYFVGVITNECGLGFFRTSGWFEWTDDGWKPTRRTVIQSRIRDLLKGKVQKIRDLSEKTYSVVNSRNIDEILRMLNLECDKGDTLPPLDPDVIPVKNGLLRWNAETLDFDFSAYTKNDLVFSKLDAVYAPEANQDFFLTKLAEVLPDVEDQRVVQEYMGAALFSENRTRRFMMFQGEGGCGKSFLVRLLTGILTRGRTFDVEFKSLKGDFAFSALTTQTLLTASEAVSEAFCKSTGIEFVKKAVGGDFFESQRKYENEKYGHYGFYSMIIVSNNELVFRYDGRGDEFKDRLIPILFNTHIDNPDKTLADKLLKDHKSAILNWLLEGAKRVRTNDWNIQLSDEQIDRRDRIVEATRGIDLFVKNHIVASTGKSFRTSDAYEIYTKLHKTARYEYLEEAVFQKRLSKAMAREYGATVSNTVPIPYSLKKARGYRGFKLVTEVPTNEKKNCANNPSHPSIATNNERTENNE